MDSDCFAVVCSLLSSVRETLGSRTTILWQSEIKKSGDLESFVCSD